MKDLIVENNEENNTDDIIIDLLAFQTKRHQTSISNVCLVNSSLQSKFEVRNYNSQSLEISNEYIHEIELSDYLKIYIKLNFNSHMVYLILKKIFVTFNKKRVKKIKLYHVGFSTIDEEMYSILADFLLNNPQITQVSIKMRKMEQFSQVLETVYDSNEDFASKLSHESEDDKLINIIQNKQHFFNFYQILSKKINLIELRILLVISDNHLALLTYVLLHNKNLRILEIRNMVLSHSYRKAKELDLGYKEYTTLGTNITDEIAIFFNYLVQLEFLEKFHMTHFWYNSDINFFACESAKALLNLRDLSLQGNQSIISNDQIALECYGLEKTGLRKLNLGLTYFHMIRRFDYIIHADRLKEVDIGVLDFVSMSSLFKFLEKTSLERVTLTLNKPCTIESIEILFNQITGAPFKAKNLKYFYVFNAYSTELYNSHRRLFIFFVENLLKTRLEENNSIRKLSFKKKYETYYSIKKNFKYVKKKNYKTCVNIILGLTQVFESRHIKFSEKKIEKRIFYQAIHKRVIHFIFAESRKIVLTDE